MNIDILRKKLVALEGFAAAQKTKRRTWLMSWVIDARSLLNTTDVAGEDIPQPGSLVYLSKTQANNGWYEAASQPPWGEGFALCYAVNFDDHNYFIARYLPDRGAWECKKNLKLEWVFPTHWMFLPKPPTDGPQRSSQ